MVGEGQPICYTGSTGFHIQFCQSPLQSLVEYLDASGMLDTHNSTDNNEDVYQVQGAQESRVG